jgi:hypothetical protein
MVFSNFLPENTLISDSALIGSTACTGDSCFYAFNAAVRCLSFCYKLE